MYDRQVALEEEMLNMGVKRYREFVSASVEGKTEGDTSYGLRLTKHLVHPLAQAITSFLTETKEAMARKPFPPSRAYRILSEMKPEVASLLAVRVVLNAISHRRKVNTTALAIGAAIEDECRFRQFKAASKNFFDVVLDRVNHSTTNEDQKRTVLIHAMNKAAEKGQVALHWEEWTVTEKVHVGLKLLDLLLKSTSDFIQVTKIPGVQAGHHLENSYVLATEALMKEIESHKSEAELLCPFYLPMLVPPKDWKHSYEGGYLTTAIRPQTLVKTRNERYLEELTHKRGEITDVLQTVNALQRTAWKINEPIYYLAQQMWDEGLGISADVMPERDDIPLPPRPHDIDTNEEARKAWKRSARPIHEANARNKSKRIQLAQMLGIAAKFKDEKEIYFPHQLDFRGRIYTIPSTLTPQGTDLSKSLLCFATGKKVTASGLRWLKIHAANCFGEDKCSLSERIVWADAHLASMIGCSKDPLTNRWWTEADKPWQFLAACMELDAVTSNPDYESRLPVSVDGSCNGLQNFSAMLRDSVGGRAVNLVPQARPNDIYERVAEVVRTKVETDVQQGVEFAQDWLDFGFDRKMTKRPVMTLPYGAKQYSGRQYVKDYVEERGGNPVWKNGVDAVGKPKDQTMRACSYMGRHVWHSIGEVVVAARAAMDWLQVAARISAKAELPVNWQTPCGFPVWQAYYDHEMYRIKVTLGKGLIHKTAMFKETDKIHRRKQANGISPNFVHSMDAAALMMCVRRALQAGVTSFGMVHDSYGTHASDMDTLATCLREAFVELYQHDVLEDFRNSILAMLPEKLQAKVPPCPAKGDLDLNVVRQSVYFFA